MPYPTAHTPKYRRHRASGQAIVTIASQDHYLGPWKSKASLAEYDRLIGEWLVAGRPSAPAPRQGEVTVSHLIAAFWRFAKKYYLKRGLPTGTTENYKPALSWLRRRYGHTQAGQFGPLALKALQAAMVEAGHSRRYVNDNIARIKRVFKWSASEQLLPANIPQALQTVEGLRKGLSTAREPPPVLPVDDVMVEATLPHLPTVVADMVRLQRLTGARPGEICSMRPGDIERSAEVWKYVPAEHKTEHHGRERTIFLGPRAQAILLPYLLRESAAFCFAPAESETQRLAQSHAQRRTPLSCGNRPGTNRKRNRRKPAGKRYTNDSYRRAIARACEVAFGMPERLRKISGNAGEDERAARRKEAAAWRATHVWHPHQLRHTAGTEIRHKFGLEAAQVSLGHSRLEATQIYAERDEKLAVRVAREVG